LEFKTTDLTDNTEKKHGFFVCTNPWDLIRETREPVVKNQQPATTINLKPDKPETGNTPQNNSAFFTFSFLL
jgi:hypothetical protein